MIVKKLQLAAEVAKSKASVKILDAPNKIPGDTRVKCLSLSEGHEWNALDDPDMLCMLKSKFSEQVTGRWNRTV